jgi:hypothetical protein
MSYTSTKNDIKHRSLTIYHDGFGVVKEIRTMDIVDKKQKIYYLDIAQKIEMDSIMIAGLDVQQMSFENGITDKNQLLERYLDQMIYLYDKKQNEKTPYRLISFKESLIVENMVTKEIIINPSDEIILPQLPNGFIPQPGLVWKVSRVHQKDIHVSYITKGFRWNSNYIINLKQNTFDLIGWMHIHNQTGTSFYQTDLKLISGKIHRVPSQGAEYTEGVRLYSVDHHLHKERLEGNGSQSYHVYTCPDKINLENNQSKQIQFLHQTDIPYQKYYESESFGYELAKEIPVAVRIEFSNDPENGLGSPLPKGKVKVYGEDLADHSLEFMGEDQIEHIPHGGTVRLMLGNTFDVKLHSRSIHSSVKLGYKYCTHEYVVQNLTKEKIRFKLNHYLYNSRSEWISSSHPFEKEDTRTYTCWLDIEANHSEIIRVKYRTRD